MKRFLILLVMILPLFTYGIENKDAEKMEALPSHYVVLARVDVDLSKITYPYVISIPAPSERVIGISGPTHPNSASWDVKNGILKIIYTNPMEFAEYAPGDTPGVEVATNPMKYYIIILNCR